MRCLMAAIVTLAAALPAAAQPWYARGDFNAWAGTANQLTDMGGGHYKGTVSGLFASDPNTQTFFYNEYKITVDDWSINAPGSNGKVATNTAGEITFHLWDNTSWSDGWYPNNQRRVGYDDPSVFGWEVVGSFNGWPATADPSYALTDQTNGLYHGEFLMNPGFYEFKFRKQGDWANAIGADFGKDSGNNGFRVWSANELWKFDLDLPNGRWRAYTDAPSPDWDKNNKVDARDYVLWRKNNGSQAAYDVWRANFGFSLPWYIRGSFNNFDTSTPLIDQGNGHFTATVTGLTAGTDYEYKAAHDDYSGAVPGSNGKVRADANGEIHFHFYELDGGTWTDGWSPANESRVGYDDHNLFDWEIVGSFNAWLGTGDPAYYLTDQGGGLHTGTFVFAAAGTYEFKFRQQGDWGTSIGDNFGNSAGNNEFVVANIGDSWTFELDLPHGRWRAFQTPLVVMGAAVPEPASVALLGFVAVLISGVRRRS